MQASIIAIGNEILIGQIINTNASWIAVELNKKGILVSRMITIPDNHDAIVNTLKAEAQISDFVIVTGGLGPTRDDITKAAICEYFNTSLVLNHEVLKNVEKFVLSKGGMMNDLNRNQALVPEGFDILQNLYGTAPGLQKEWEGTTFFFFPGVPHEMKFLMEHYVLAGLSKIQKNNIVHYTCLVHGIPEAKLAIQLADWEDNLPSEISLAYLPQPGLIRLRLSAVGKEEKLLKKLIGEEVKKLIEIIPEHFMGGDVQSSAEYIHKLFIHYNKSLALAESCTGGAISGAITLIPGSSAYFNGAVIAYSNEVKINQLEVPAKIIESHGSVSKEVVESMANGVRKNLNADYSIAVSGIAGPGGGSPEKPVGTVWIAVAGPSGVISKRFNFGDTRERNILKSVNSAFKMLSDQLKSDLQLR